MGAGEVWFAFHRDSVRQEFAVRARTGDLADVIDEIDEAARSIEAGCWPDATRHLVAAARTAEERLNLYGGEAGPSLDSLLVASEFAAKPRRARLDDVQRELQAARRRFLCGHQKAAVEYLGEALSLFEHTFLEY